MRNYLSGGRPDLPLVIHVGRLVLEKGSLEIPEIIMNTAKEMGKENVRFCIVGDGNLRQAVEKKIAEYGLQDIVVFTGMLFGKELYSAYASSDVFFSQSCSEAFSLVYLEAQSSRLAVVGPDVGEDFIFSDGKQGHLFAPHDPRSAGVAIKAAIEGGDRMKDEAYAHGKSFSWPRAIEELEHSLVETYKRKLESGFVGCKASKS
jgi:glycosyltransferase involved in cell wall biosynthesis